MELQPLDFENRSLKLQRRLQDLKNHSDEHDVDLDSAVKAVEDKAPRNPPRDLRQSNCLAACPNRAACRSGHSPSDYIERCFTNWIELHGDRRFADDKAMPSGLATLGTQRCVVITHQKGRNTKENVMRNFGCAHPEGYRKALAIDAAGRKIWHARRFH